jgi:hypothetical protein
VTLAAEILAAAEAIRGWPCLLCHGPAAGMDVFFPADRFARQMGELPGSKIMSPLCGRCAEHPDRETRIETELLRRARKNRS